MFVVFLRFGSQKARAAEFMEAHNRWIQEGIAAGAFLVVGSLKPQAGGAILAYGLSGEELHARVQEDPFVQHGVVSAEIHEIAPARADERLAFLLGAPA
jgi:uncharacterized protein YciI